MAHIYFYHGSNALASRQALGQLLSLYGQKHGSTNRYQLDGSEADFPTFKLHLLESLTSQSLFPQPTLTVLLRPTIQDKGKKGDYTLILVKQLERLLAERDPNQTILIWEDQLLLTGHALWQFFQDHRADKWLKILEYSCQDSYSEVKRLSAVLQTEGWTLSQAGGRYLVSCMDAWLKQQRLLERKKPNQPLLREQRPFQLQQVIETAKLLSQGRVLTNAVLEQAVGEIEGQVSVFEISDSIFRRQWSKAIKLLNQWEYEEYEDGAYFGLLAILRQNCANSELPLYNQVGLRLLADAELIAKNGLWPLPIIAEQIVFKLEQSARGLEVEGLVRGKNLWLSVLPKS